MQKRDLRREGIIKELIVQPKLWKILLAAILLVEVILSFRLSQLLTSPGLFSQTFCRNILNLMKLPPGSSLKTTHAELMIQSLWCLLRM